MLLYLRIPQVGLFLARPTMFTVMAMSLGTYVVKPFFPECHDPPEVPVKIVTILAMRKSLNSLHAE